MAPSYQVISRQIAQGFGGGTTRVRLDPVNGYVMMGTDILMNASDVVNDDLIASGLNGVVPEEAHAVLAETRQTGVEEVPSEARIQLRA